MYKLPLGIRIPRDNEYPENYNVNEINAKRMNAKIVEGYTQAIVEDKKYKYYIEINIDCDNIWNLFIDLSNTIIDDKAYGIIGMKDEKPFLSEFMEKENVIKAFEKYRIEVTNDGFIEFGIASYDDKILNEIYISNFKYFKIWTTKFEELTKVLDKYKLKCIQDLQFIDEFPVVSEAINTDNYNELLRYVNVISNIKEILSK